MGDSSSSTLSTFTLFAFDSFIVRISVRGCIASRLYLKDTKLNLDCQAQNQVRGENNLSDKKTGQAEPYFLPALVPLCRSIADLLILSIRVDSELHQIFTERTKRIEYFVDCYIMRYISAHGPHITTGRHKYL